MNEIETHSSTLCMVLLTKPNSRQGAIFFIKRASDVPPVVEKTGLILVILLITFFAICIDLPGFVIKASPLGINKTLNLHFLFLQIFAIVERIFFCKDLAVWKVLYLMLNWALIDEGITLCALLSTSILVNSKFDGWKFFVRISQNN